MLIYTENRAVGYPEASIHNVDTGFTYVLQRFGNFTPEVRLWLPAAEPSRILYMGEQALAFWRLLLARMPVAPPGVSPEAFLERLPGVEASVAHEDGDKAPF